MTAIDTPIPLSSPRPRIVPNAYVLLSNWRYIEHSILRMIAGWGRNAGRAAFVR